MSHYNQKRVNNFGVIKLWFKVGRKTSIILFFFSLTMLSVPFLLTTTYFTSPLVHPPPVLPPLDILSHYKAWFGSLVCVHVVPLCKRPRLKLCGKSSASFLNTPGITVQGLRREGERGGREEKRQREWKEGVEERSRGQIEVLREERLLTGGRGGPRKKGRGERLRPERDLSESILTAGLNRRSDRRRNGGEKKAENGEKRKRMTELLKINLASLSEGAEEGNASNRKHHRIKTLRPNQCTVALKEETHSNEVLKVTGGD